MADLRCGLTSHPLRHAGDITQKGSDLPRSFLSAISRPAKVSAGAHGRWRVRMGGEPEGPPSGQISTSATA
ncbi:hypothetical protein Tdes44962_MAKER09507 [Teratosphaeria destructans]|uniref:Uncharacterized protein n=1 Tax=Teratosphaeria destructans TaxID=418781 RepID=A0A9W7SSW7_9PEZI|nr:hypothetical protein Tdes44962_MAKER09507 [Teratosphaeria destructans]